MKLFYVVEMIDTKKPVFCMDTNGEVLVFDTELEAEVFALTDCYKGVVVATSYVRGFERNEKEAKVAEVAYIYAKKGAFSVAEADLMDIHNILYTPIYTSWVNLPKMVNETPKSDGVVGYITEYTNEVIDILNKDISGEVSEDTLRVSLNNAFKSIIDKYNNIPNVDK